MYICVCNYVCINSCRWIHFLKKTVHIKCATLVQKALMVCTFGVSHHRMKSFVLLLICHLLFASVFFLAPVGTLSFISLGRMVPRTMFLCLLGTRKYLNNSGLAPLTWKMGETVPSLSVCLQRVRSLWRGSERGQEWWLLIGAENVEWESFWLFLQSWRRFFLLFGAPYCSTQSGFLKD